MKIMLLAALAMLSLGAAAASAQSLNHSAPPQQTQSNN
jgi:hypothetical protein